MCILSHVTPPSLILPISVKSTLTFLFNLRLRILFKRLLLSVFPTKHLQMFHTFSTRAKYQTSHTAGIDLRTIIWSTKNYGAGGGAVG